MVLDFHNNKSSGSPSHKESETQSEAQMSREAPSMTNNMTIRIG